MRLLLISVLLSFLLTNCPIDGGLNQNGPLVKMTAVANPDSVGTANPPSGTYSMGTEIKVEAISNSNRYKFVGWTGDTTASDNPLIFKIRRDMHLVANYKIPVSAFSNRIVVTDSTNPPMHLTFGMDTTATAGFDDGIDEELPPPPPSGSFYAQFDIPDYALSKDFRPLSINKTVWKLEAAPQSGHNLTFSWDFSGTNQMGSLTLTDDPDNPTFRIDMKNKTQYQLSTGSKTILYIIDKR